MEPTRLDKAYWEQRYLEADTRWDVHAVSTPLKNYFDQLKNKNASVLIPGCGNAHEAVYLLELGFTDITLIDIAAPVVEAVAKRLEQYLGKELRLICGDFFELQQQFDLIIEQTFFCALDPALRTAYASKMFDCLHPKGKLVGLLFDFPTQSGPPFGGEKKEYEQLFQHNFSILTMERCYNSIAPRAGTELFIMLQKKWRAAGAKNL